ncbi:MAG TPA: small, acid-soluble spore protein, alpha/beta type [Firmicutes bacterium]|nr:small, acid-soluble spore protein, alpha/beta type [Bacillota bacterium]
MAKTLKKIRRELLQDEIKRSVLKRLGYLEEVKEKGWDSLSSRECGRIGGLIRKEKKSR